MHVNQIKEVIISQQEEYTEIFEKERIIEREVKKEDLLAALQYPNILVLLGPRRSGKSILSLSLLKEKKFGYINFDDERLFGMKAEDLNAVLQAFYELYGDIDYLVLDEIQNIPGWELFANRLRRTKRVIITGSNSKLLSGELATKLTGRYIDFTLFPFSFREYLSYMSVDFEKSDIYSTKFRAKIKNYLKEYMKLGGFPECYKFGSKILPRIYRDLIEKDIVQKHKIKDPIAVRELAKLLISSFSKEISFKKMKEHTKIKNVHTVSKYVSYISSAYLLFLVNKFSFKLREQFKAPKKVYCIDPGIINSISFQVSENIGRLMENVVAIELIRSKHYADSQEEIYYWKNQLQEEVDFVIKSGSNVKQLIQVCYDTTETNTKEREIKALLKASHELRCNNLLVVTDDYECEEVIDGKKVNFVPLWKWLLTK